MPWYYEMFDFVGEEYFSVLNREKLRKAKKEVATIRTALALQPGQEILDLCCGVGRHTLLLARVGYKVTGLDASTRLLEIADRKAKDEGLEVEFLPGDMRAIPFKDKFDIVLNLWNSFGYLENDKEHLRVLKAIAGALKPGGRFLLDILNRDWVVRNFQAGEEHREIGGIVEINRYQFDSAAGRDVIATTYIVDGVEREFTHSCRIYTLQEIKMLLDMAGLKLCQAYGGYDLRPVSVEGKQLLVIAEKPS